MKKFAFFSAVLIIAIFFVTGCTQPNRAVTADNGKLSVVCTIFAPYDFTRQIAPEQADITMLLPPAAESHSYEPTPQDVLKIQNCDIFIYVGGESDAWVEEVLQAMDTSRMQLITLMDCVQTVEEEIIEGMEHTHNHDEHDEHDEHDDIEYDEHVWTSPANAQLIV